MCAAICVGLLVLLVGGSLGFWGLKKRKFIKLKQKFFERNGGLLLGSVKNAKTFTAEDLKKATNNYHPTRVIGQGRFGVVYKGILQNNQIVAIKKSKFCDQSQVAEFINEISLLTTIIHKNIVRLLGFCLETEVPLLVYEYISNDTLFDQIHVQNSLLSWEKRMKIALETANGLAYLHFKTEVPILHRDIKSSNVLLDNNFTAKIADFGASRLKPIDETHLTTLVQGTLGYLDPEYFHTSQLTDRSDVYSFGVVLAELITGRKSVSSENPECERNLAKLFVTAVNEEGIDKILDD